ncbi:hypothetical protein D3C71_20470 [compost metagenome]
MRLKSLVSSFLTWRQTRRQASSFDWRVLANDVHVGSLPNEELRAMRRAVVCDWRNYVRQAAYFVQFAMHLASQLVYFTPLAWFWLLVASSCLDQAGMSEFFARVMVEPSVLVDALVKSFGFAFGVSAVAVALRVGVESAFCRHLAGFSNAFLEDANRRLRLRFNLVTGADFRLERQWEGLMAAQASSTGQNNASSTETPLGPQDLSGEGSAPAEAAGGAAKTEG